MDRKLIEQYGEDILSYRLRTARQKKRAQRADFDKKLLRLDRERRALGEIEANLGWEVLTPPIQKGWQRCFVLRDDVARSKHAEFYEGILKKINTYDWSHRKDFMIRKRRYGNNKFVVKLQRLYQPTADDFHKHQYTEAERRQFYEVNELDWRGRPFQYFVFDEPWRFELKVRPNMITKVKRYDAIIESKLAEIENYLERNAYSNKLGKILSGSIWNWCSEWPDERGTHEFNNKSLTQIMDMIRET